MQPHKMNQKALPYFCAWEHLLVHELLENVKLQACVEATLCRLFSLSLVVSSSSLHPLEDVSCLVIYVF